MKKLLKVKKQHLDRALELENQRLKKKNEEHDVALAGQRNCLEKIRSGLGVSSMNP